MPCQTYRLFSLRRRDSCRNACFVTARPVAQSHSTVLMCATEMSTCNSRQLLNLLDIRLPLLPHGGHVSSHTSQLLPATGLEWKVGHKMETWDSKWKNKREQLLGISLQLLPHGRHVCSDAGQLLLATNLHTKQKVGPQNRKLAHKMETWPTRLKIGTQKGELAI